MSTWQFTLYKGSIIKVEKMSEDTRSWRVLKGMESCELSTETEINTISSPKSGPFPYFLIHRASFNSSRSFDGVLHQAPSWRYVQPTSTEKYPDYFYDIGLTIKLFDLRIGALSPFTVCTYSSEHHSQYSSFKAEEELFMGLWNSPAFRAVYWNWEIRTWTFPCVRYEKVFSVRRLE